MSKPKILEQIDNAGGVFIATYGTTTYQEIKDAYDSGKDIVCYYNNEIFDLCTIPTGSDTLYFYERLKSANNNGYASTYVKYISMSSTDGWGAIGALAYNRVGAALMCNGSTSISSSLGYYRPIRLSTAEPTSNDGNVGDIWIQYEE